MLCLDDPGVNCEVKVLGCHFCKVLLKEVMECSLAFTGLFIW